MSNTMCTHGTPHAPATFTVHDPAQRSTTHHDGTLATLPGVFVVRLCRYCGAVYWEPDGPTENGVRGRLNVD